MKTLKTVLLLVPALLSTGAYASETEAYYDGAKGEVTLPHLNIGNEIYYVEMKLIDSSSLTFQVIPASILKITPAAGFVAPSKSLIVGSWVYPDDASSPVTFNSDGTYVISNAPGDAHCGGGGEETGNYLWDTETGVLVLRAKSSYNDLCGISGKDGVSRISITGNQMVYSDMGVLESGFDPSGTLIRR